MKEEKLFSGTDAARILCTTPSLISAWTLRKLIKPAEEKVLTPKKKVFRYDFINLIELEIIRSLSDYFSIRYDLLNTLALGNYDSNRRLIEEAMKMSDPYLFVFVKEGMDKVVSQPDRVPKKNEEFIEIDFKLTSWKKELADEIQRASFTLIINILQIRQRLQAII